jgi:hypothetical protein
MDVILVRAKQVEYCPKESIPKGRAVNNMLNAVATWPIDVAENNNRMLVIICFLDIGIVMK